MLELLAINFAILFSPAINMLLRKFKGLFDILAVVVIELLASAFIKKLAVVE